MLKPFLYAAILATAASASAQLRTFSLNYYSNQSQISDAVPSASQSWTQISFMDSPVEGFFTSGEVVTPVPGGRIDPMVAAGNFIVHFGPYTATASQIINEYPTGSYIFRGNHAGGQIVRTLPNSTILFPVSTPYLSSGSWSNLQGCLAGLDQTVSLNTFNPNAGTTGQSYIQITNYVTQGSAHNDSGPGNSFSSSTIPGSELRSGHYYGYTVSFDEARTPVADGSVRTQKNTGGYFKVLANPGTVSGQLDLTTLTPYAKIYSVQVLDSGGNVLESFTELLGYDGWYAIDSTQTGIVSLRFDCEGYLSRVISNVNLDAGIDYLNVTLPNGDINDDGEIGPGDFAELAAVFGIDASDPNYTNEVDLDDNGEIGPSDFALLSSNFGLEDE